MFRYSHAIIRELIIRALTSTSNALSKLKLYLSTSSSHTEGVEARLHLFLTLVKAIGQCRAQATLRQRQNSGPIE